MSYGDTILSYDRASERTYRQLMMMKYSSGDRTGALRLYDRCVTALREELAVKPERQTTALYDHIRADGSGNAETPAPLDDSSLTEILGRLKRLQLILGAVQKRVQRDIAAVELASKQLSKK